jgi:signal transduction histidine kinase
VEDFNHVPTEFIQQLAVQMGIAIQQAEFVEQLQQYTTELETMVDKRTTQLRESEHNEHEQRLFAEGMLEIVKKINQSLDLEHVLEQILINLENIVNYDSAQIIITDTDDDRVIVQRRGNLQVDERAARPTAVDDYPAFVKMARTGEPILIREAAHRSLLADEADGYNVESYLGTPIQSGRRLLGFINLYGTQAGAFDGTDMAHLQAFAEQVSVAVKNARLYKKAQELATLEERQRLARDLHDAVSQLIFSLSIMAESLPGLLRKEKYERAMDLSTTMRTVASSAHAEMQLLLLELRPMRFEHIEIAELLQQLVNAFLGRHAALATSVQADETPPLPIEVKNTLYRIAQEALNNVGKHAEAKNIEIKLWVHNNIIHLSVEDDGQGFDATEAPEGHGLWIMRERAESIAATCSIESQAGAGTRVHVTYKVSG